MRPFAAVLLLSSAALSAQAAAKIDFVAQVAPILQQHCVACHGEAKAKGKLRLDRKASMFAADAEVAVVVAGKPEASELIRRISLPADDDDVMPQKAEPLAPAQIEMLRQWIAQGAVWPDDGDDYFAQRGPVATPKLEVEVLDAAARARVDRALSQLQELGAVAQRLAKDSDAVDVNLGILGDQVGDAQLAPLAELAPVLVWLDLGRTKVGDQGMQVVGGLRQLRRLHLQNTAVGDAGVAALASLQRLEYLNLYGSKLTDRGLAALAPLRSLRRLFVWQTAVTAAGVDALQRELPALHVDRGDYAEARLQAARQQVAAAADQPPINTTCPVSGKPIDAGTAIDFDGVRIAFCCTKCRAEFTADPKRFRAVIDGYKQQASVASPEPKKQ